MLHLSGYNLSMDDLKAFRQSHSKTPGHPESFMTDGIEVTTGPLGQGISNAVGLAIAEENMRARYNRPGFPVIDNFTYVFCGDGCLQEGVSAEASSLAGHLGLGRLIVLYDDNDITIDGKTNLSFTEDVLKRYEAYGWHTSRVMNGNDDLAGLKEAILTAQKVTDRPSIISVKTIIGYGSLQECTHSVHGEVPPLPRIPALISPTKHPTPPLTKITAPEARGHRAAEGEVRVRPQAGPPPLPLPKDSQVPTPFATPPSRSTSKWPPR